jgi:predicted aldo/keto reductase-like oxidoreductase
MYTLVMPTLNQPNLESLNHELNLAGEKGVGVMAMKTMKGIDDRALQLAFLKKVLAHPAVTTVVKGIGSFEMFDAYRKASQETLTVAEDKGLYRHAQSHRSANCMMCGECRRNCPMDVEIPAVLRCKDYYYDQMGDVETARSTFGEIPSERIGHDDCRLCLRCEEVCPNGIGIVERMAAARKLFVQPGLGAHGTA